MEINQLHSWQVSTREAARIQVDLREKVLLRSESNFESIQTIAAADVSSHKSENVLYAAVVIMQFSPLKFIDSYWEIAPAQFPYVPGYLSFREAPVIVEIFKKISHPPDVLLCDGQGIAHPRGLGLASHLGLFLDLPTIGCAKSVLVGNYEEPGPSKGDQSPLIYQGRQVGVALRTRSHVKPIFISCGHKIGLSEAIRIILHVSPRYRIPEPLRIAHQMVNEIRVKNQK